MAKAERPLIYAGGGVVSSGGHEVLRNIQAEFSVPVATTTMGKGSIDENHSLSIGPIGYYMGIRGVTRHLKNYVENSDVILLVGNRTNQNGTDSWTLLPEDATYIHIDIDPTEIGRNYDALRLVGDAKTSLEQLYDALKNKDISKRIENRENVEEEIRKSRKLHEEALSDVLEDGNNDLIKVERLLKEVNEQLTDNHIIVADASISSVWNANYIKAENNRKFIFPRGLAGLGWGLPLAMGAKVGSSDRKVFVLVGDGGFGHVWSELETCKRLGIDVVVAVINNSILGYQKYAETAGFNRYTNVCDFNAVDHTKVAEACGIKGIKLEDVDKISETFEEAFKYDGSVVVDVITDPVNIPPVTTMDELIEDK